MEQGVIYEKDGADLGPIFNLWKCGENKGAGPQVDGAGM
jgi:hypothetical protein